MLPQAEAVVSAGITSVKRASYFGRRSFGHLDEYRPSSSRPSPFGGRGTFLSFEADTVAIDNPGHLVWRGRDGQGGWSTETPALGAGAPHLPCP